MSMRAAADGPMSGHVVRWGFRAEGLVQWGVAGLVLFLVMAPLVPILIQAMVDRPLYESGATASLRNVHHAARRPGLRRRGCELCRCSPHSEHCSTQILGAAFAILIGRTDMPAKALMAGIILTPLYLSQLVLTTGWLIIYGPAGYVTTASSSAAPVPWDLYTIPGMAIAAAVCQMPITFLYCQRRLKSADAALEDVGPCRRPRPWERVRRITLPLLLPALTITGILNFVMLLEACRSR